MNIQKMMQQAKKMQQQMEEAQAKLAEAEFTGTSGGDMVKIVISGKNDVKSLKIDPSIIDPEDPEVLEDLIVAAFNNAKKESDESQSGSMEDMMGGMGLPPGFKMPF